MPPRSTLPALRASAWATFSFALFQLWALPMPLHRDGAGGWVVEYGTILNVAVTVAVAVLLRRGSRVAGALAGLYGAWRMGWALVAVASVLTGTWARFGEPSWVISRVVVVPFAAIWLWGGFAVARDWRRGRVAEAAA